ncbi:MAG: FecR domain-containing protein [Planctomycetota bacterium]
MNNPSRIEELSQRVADGLADEATIAELETLMRDDSSAREVYLQTLQLHQDLERKAARGTLHGGRTSIEPPLPLEPSRRRAGPIVAVAAVLLVAVNVWFWLIDPSGVGAVGEIVEVTETTWATAPPSKSLERDQHLQLTSGSVELRLASGVRVVLEGQVDAVLTNTMEIALHAGQLFASVPNEVHGFRVITRGMDVVDLGTQFGVRVGKTGADVHVFEGEVEVRPSTKSQEKQTLKTAQAARFNPQGALETWIAPDYEGFAAPRLAPGVVSTAKAVHWFENPPSTFGFTEEKTVALVLERKNVLLTQPLEITFDRTRFMRNRIGTNSAYDSHRKVLEAGTRVDSYLLHFHPKASGRGPNGSVQFDRPILGAIARGDQLAASDEILGLPSLTYPTGARRGLEGESDALDVITMGKGQLAVRFWASGSNVDQVRVLVESLSPELLQPLDEK